MREQIFLISTGEKWQDYNLVHPVHSKRGTIVAYKILDDNSMWLACDRNGLFGWAMDDWVVLAYPSIWFREIDFRLLQVHPCPMEAGLS